MRSFGAIFSYLDRQGFGVLGVGKLGDEGTSVQISTQKSFEPRVVQALQLAGRLAGLGRRALRGRGTARDRPRSRSPRGDRVVPLCWRGAVRAFSSLDRQTWFSWNRVILFFSVGEATLLEKCLILARASQPI